MNVTDNVIRDLLPVYLAGEASADTRTLVEEYLKEHPALAAEAKQGAAWSLPEVPGHVGCLQALGRAFGLDAEQFGLAMHFGLHFCQADECIELSEQLVEGRQH